MVLTLRSLTEDKDSDLSISKETKVTDKANGYRNKATSPAGKKDVKGKRRCQLWGTGDMVTMGRRKVGAEKASKSSPVQLYGADRRQRNTWCSGV